MVATSSDAVDPSSKGDSAGRACKPITDREGTLGRFRFVILARPVADRKTHRSEGGGVGDYVFFRHMPLSKKQVIGRSRRGEHILYIHIYIYMFIYSFMYVQ